MRLTQRTAQLSRQPLRPTGQRHSGIVAPQRAVHLAVAPMLCALVSMESTGRVTWTSVARRRAKLPDHSCLQTNDLLSVYVIQQRVPGESRGAAAIYISLDCCTTSLRLPWPSGTTWGLYRTSGTTCKSGPRSSGSSGRHCLCLFHRIPTAADHARPLPTDNIVFALW
jgi:hypothetical protein